ncbi:DUF1801 domain-containing protein [Dyadobacter sp. CY312]|uniref:DUF1801 domain-containing protein n=1 Tax=Dyadobacter sp. CY312 TaxID=2907303 RepID=UPI001F3DCE77|nr:DUF1801 domain-containing protein [Dyadobacter sp. CY312]MCE7040245.1 DUF1801 domain-containing protein [Dyadobacter sp. CY312]
MAKNKTAETSVDVYDFINLVDDEQKRKDSYSLIELMQEVSGHEPKMWGPSIIGFGTYHYRYESGHEGDAPILGFSPRKAAISLYIYTGLEEHQYLLEDLGKYKIGKACIYVKKLADINEKSMIAIMKKSIEWVNEKYPA